MISSQSRVKKSVNKPLQGLLLVIVLLFSMTKVYAGPIPNFDQEVSLTAREQPINTFMQELFGQIGVPVLLDTRIEGNINGRFSGTTAREVFDDLAKSFGLIAYYDGAVTYIYTANDMSQYFLSTPKHLNNQIVKGAYDLGLPDARNEIQPARGGGLVVRGTKRFVEQIKELVFAAKNNTDFYQLPMSFKVFYLKYAWAQDVTVNFAGKQAVIPGVASTLRYLTDDNSAYLHAAQQSGGSDNANTSAGLRGQGLANVNTEGRLGLDASAIPLPMMNAGALPGLGSSDVRIGVDPRLNAVIVRDSPDRMSRYKELIDALDVEPQMLEIEATIIDINTDRLRELGINWRSIRDNDQFLFGSGGGSDLALNEGQVITPQGLGGFASFVFGDRVKFITRINALETKGAARVVSSPHVLTLSNVEALFDTSSTFYVRLAGDEEVDLFNISVGTSLRVTPHVFKDNGTAKIKLLINIEDGQQEDQLVDNIPVLRKSLINTQALINANESVLIGGLVREASIDRVNKVPLLGDVPVLGNLFKSKEKRTERIERMFLISPRLVSPDRQSREAASYTNGETSTLAAGQGSLQKTEKIIVGGDKFVDRLNQGNNWLESYDYEFDN